MTEPLDVRFTSNAPEVTPGVEKLAAATQKVATTQQAAAQSGGKAVTANTQLVRAHREAATGAERSGKAHSALGVFVQRLGGQFGVTSQSMGKFGAALGLVAAGAVLVRIAAQQYTKHLEHEKQILGEVIDKTFELRHARDTANASLQKTGLDAAGDQGQALRRVVANGGSLSQVDALNRKGATGAAEGLAALQDIRDLKARATAQEAALKVQTLGGGSFAEVAKGIAQNRGIFSGDSDKTAAFYLSRGAQTRTTAADVRSGLGAVGANPITGALSELDQIAGEKERRTRGLIPQGVGAARADLAETSSPLSAALVKIARSDDERLEKLGRIADSLSNFASFWDRATKGSGSAKGQYQDALRVRGALAAEP